MSLMMLMMLLVIVCTDSAYDVILWRHKHLLQLAITAAQDMSSSWRHTTRRLVALLLLGATRWLITTTTSHGGTRYRHQHQQVTVTMTTKIEDNTKNTSMKVPSLIGDKSVSWDEDTPCSVTVSVTATDWVLSSECYCGQPSNTLCWLSHDVTVSYIYNYNYNN